MSLTCKVQVTLNNISEKKAHAVRMALEPDNVNFPENLTLEVENVDNKLVFNFQSQGNMEKTQNKVELDYKKLALTIPNLIHESVPIGVDETANKEIKKWGEPPRLDFKVQDHVDFSTSLDLVDLERAAKVAGARFYFLKNDLVQLNQALIQYA